MSYEFTVFLIKKAALKLLMSSCTEHKKRTGVETPVRIKNQK
jgi:hypothetical protein